MLEIYNETVRDLLTSKSNSRDLGKQLDSIRNGNPSDLTVVDVRSIGEVSYLLTQAAQSRYYFVNNNILDLCVLLESTIHFS